MAKLLYLVFFAAIAWQVNASSKEHLLSRAKDPDWGSRCLVDGKYSDPDHCNTYIECTERTKSIKQCPTGLEFNYELEKCVEPCKAYCNKTLSCECKWSTCGVDDICFQERKIGPCRAGFSRYWFNRTSGQCQMFYWGGCRPNENNFETKQQCENKCGNSNEPSLPVAFKCPEDGLYPYPYHCNKFIQCSEGSVSVMNCPGDKHFSRETQRCESACSAKCDRTKACECGWDSCGSDVGDTLLEPSADFETKETCGSECQQTKHDEESTTEVPIHLRDAGCYFNGFLPDFDNCSQYFQCFDNGTKLTMPCKSGLHYNQALNRCTEPCDAFCDVTIACKCGWPTCNKSAEEPDIFTCDHDGLNSNSQECKAYYALCSNGYKHDMLCPKGLHFSKEAQRCVSPCDAHCDKDLACECGWPTCRNDFKCEDDGLYKHPENCSTFIQCSNGERYDMPCPKGLHFSEKTNRCESPCNAHCDKDSACKCGWPTCKKADDFMCVKDGLYKNPEFCSAYIHCSNGRKHDMPCPTGQHFSEKTLKCESPCEAHCDDDLACPCNWTECRESSNNFCRLPADTGPCRARIPKYYFNYKLGKCEKFHYGGCKGNRNNFDTLEECARRCSKQAESSVDTCKLPAVTGPCEGSIPRFYYDHERRKCMRFFYGGCKGNANNFLLKSDCEQICSPKLYGRVCSLRAHFKTQNILCQKNCSNWKQHIPCHQGLKQFGCFCDEGYVKGSDGKCILPSECPKSEEGPKGRECAEHAHFKTDNILCQKNCSNWRQHIPCHHGLKQFGCFCDEGYVSGPGGKCIRPDECTKSEEVSEEKCICGEHAHFTRDYMLCQKNCSNWRKYIPCHHGVKVLGCFCYSGYVKGPEGKCIPPDRCMHSAEESKEEPKCAEHEHFEPAGTMCQRNCSNWNKSVICNMGLMPGCFCDDGYVRGTEGKCVPTSECTKFEEESEDICPVNEQSSVCGAACQRDCTNYKDWIFICPLLCRPGCVCKKGLVRNSLGKCIPTDECRSDKAAESEPETFSCPLPSGKYAHPYDCSAFYECEGGVPKLRSCQGRQYFDRIIRACVEERLDAQCSYQCVERDGKFPHPLNDKMFIRCTNNSPKVEQCSLGETFDAHLEDCVEFREGDTVKLS